MDTKAKSLDRIADRVLEASADVVQALACPRCAGALRIQYVEIQKPKSRKRASLYVMCESCAWRVISDGLEDEPPWVKTLGAKITTNVAGPTKTRHSA